MGLKPASELPLTEIEELMLHHHRRSYPYNCFIRLRFEGLFDRGNLESAARAAVARHPMLLARINGTSGRPKWDFREIEDSPIEWREEQIAGAFPGVRPLGPDEPGVRLIVVTGELRSELVIQWLHARCDGVGIFRFIHDLVLLYAGKPESEETILPACDPDLLAGRGKLVRGERNLFKMACNQAIGLKGVRQFLMRRPALLVPHAAEQEEAPAPEPFPAACSIHFPPEVSAGLRSRAAAAGVTVNEILARDLFVALAGFRRGRSLSADKWLRLVIPVSLRRAAHRRLPAANVLSSVFLDRRGKQLGDPDRLLSGIHEEMQLIKDHELGWTFILSLRLHRILPGGIRRAARGDRCNGTAVFSNLGKLLARTGLGREGGSLICGNVGLNAVEIISPLTPFTCVSFAAGWLGDRLSLTEHYDPRVLSAEDARELRDRFAREIGQSAGVGASGGVQESIELARTGDSSPASF